MLALWNFAENGPSKRVKNVGVQASACPRKQAEAVSTQQKNLLTTD
jgi:hypothetical protein